MAIPRRQRRITECADKSVFRNPNLILPLSICENLLSPLALNYVCVSCSIKR
jgi:hypothetical protein